MAPSESTSGTANGPRRDSERRAPIVVGIGASVAALHSTERFFSRFSLTSDQATVLVVRHREALNEGRLRETLRKLDGLTVLADELLAYHAKEAHQVRISGRPIRLQPEAAETLGLVLHELATNAVKHGALSARQGSVQVRWSIIPDGDARELTMERRELGGPSIDAPPERRGFGTELLERTLAFELNARTALGYEQAGLRCSIVLPLTAGVVMRSGQVER